MKNLFLLLLNYHYFKIRGLKKFRTSLEIRELSKKAVLSSTSTSEAIYKLQILINSTKNISLTARELLNLYQ